MENRTAQRLKSRMGPSQRMDLPRCWDESSAAQLRLVVLRLARRIRQHAGKGITPSQLSALSTLERSGWLRLGDLAERERIKKSTLTRTVARLEEAGYVQRRPDPDDGRSAQISVTERGRELITSSRRRADAYLARNAAALSPAQRDVLAAALPVLQELLEDRG